MKNDKYLDLDNKDSSIIIVGRFLIFLPLFTKPLAVCCSYVLRELIYEQIGYYHLLVQTIPISIRDSDPKMGLLVKKESKISSFADLIINKTIASASSVL